MSRNNRGEDLAAAGAQEGAEFLRRGPGGERGEALLHLRTQGPLQARDQHHQVQSDASRGPRGGGGLNALKEGGRGGRKKEKLHQKLGYIPYKRAEHFCVRRVKNLSRGSGRDDRIAHLWIKKKKSTETFRRITEMSTEIDANILGQVSYVPPTGPKGMPVENHGYDQILRYPYSTQLLPHFDQNIY